MEYVVLPFAQACLYDISKELFGKGQKKRKVLAKFKAAIQKSVRAAIKAPDGLVDSIATSILTACESKMFPDIEGIVRYEFALYNFSHLDQKIVATEISSAIVTNVLLDIDLSEEFSSRMLAEQMKRLLTLQQNAGESMVDISRLLGQVDETTRRTKAVSEDVLYRLQEIIKCFNESVQQVRKAQDTSSVIPDKYKEYFLRPLFLEHQMEDHKQATLKDVYIENKYTILDFPHQNKGKIRSGLLTFISDFIKDNLLQQDYGTPFSMPSTSLKVLFIQGHPGSGKSSLFYYLAYLKRYDATFFPDREFHFVKLIEVCDAHGGSLDTSNPLRDIEDYIGQDNPTSKQIVFVLDGLDEICAAKEFNIVEYCTNLVREAAGHRNKVKVIVTTRLNYINLPYINNKNVINIQLQNLSVDGLQSWVDKYFSVHETLEDVHEVALKNIDFLASASQEEYLDILAIPLLFYMIVVSKIDVSRINSVGHLYDLVFTELKQRNYNEADSDYVQKHGVNQKIPAELARRIAMEIAYEMYTLNRLLLRVDSDEIQQALNHAYELDHYLTENDKKDIELLFPITFFYKRTVDVVEFAHKSIMEFFVAEKLYQSLDSCAGSLRAFINKCILNPVVITNEVLSFFTYLIDSRTDNKIARFSNVIAEFEDDIRTKQVYACEGVTYPYETYKVVFKIYWYFIRRIIKCDPETVTCLLANSIVKSYIENVCSLKDAGNIPFLDNSVVHLDFSKVTLSGYEFEYSHLGHALFTNSELVNCKMSFSDLSYADFSNAVFEGHVTFLSCNMDHASFNGDQQQAAKSLSCKVEALITFTGCSFIGATFAHVDLCDIKISSIVSMNNAVFIDVYMTLSQFLAISKSPVTMDQVVIVLQRNDYTPKELQQMISVPAGERYKKLVEIVEKHLNKRQKELILGGRAVFVLGDTLVS